MTAAKTESISASQAYIPNRWHTNVQLAIVFLMLLSAPIAPRLNIALLFLLGLLSLIDLLVLNRPAKLFPSKLLTPLAAATPLMLAGYLFLNSLWARDPGVALGKAALVSAIFAVVLVCWLEFNNQSAAVRNRTAKAALLGSLIGLAIACFEFSTGHLLQWALYDTWPAIRPEGNSIKVLVDDGSGFEKVAPEEHRKQHDVEKIEIRSSGLNRNLSLMLLLQWPVLALAQCALAPRYRMPALVALFGIGSATVLVSVSQTAQIALIGSVVVFLTARFWPLFTHYTILAGWCIALIFALPLAAAPYKAGMHKSNWLFESARDRIAIWSLTAELAAKTPIFGVGIRSTRVIGKELRKSAKYGPTYAKPRRLGIHAHNQYLQVWFELGAIGAALMLALGIAILRTVRTLARDFQPYAYAAFTTAALVAAFGWGLWQTWLLVGFGVAFILLLLAKSLHLGVSSS